MTDILKNKPCGKEKYRYHKNKNTKRIALIDEQQRDFLVDYRHI
jgi:hypothetical protein